MDLTEAILARKSIRAYKPDPVPRKVLKELMEVALHAPSFANTQPWEFTIIGGQVMTHLKQALAEKFQSGAKFNHDMPWPEFPEVYRNRSREIGLGLYAALGIGREDKQKRQDWTIQGMKFFDAPNAIIFYIDKALNAWSILDVGLLVQTTMLAAQHYELGTCPQAAVVGYPEVIRNVLGIPDSKMLVVGMAIGYPDWNHPANKFRSKREPLDTFVAWRGIE